MSKKYTHKKKIVIGAIQLNSTNDIDKNLSVVTHLIETLNQEMRKAENKALKDVGR